MAVKLFVEYLHAEDYIDFEVPKWLSLGLIVVIFTVSFLYARREELRSRTRTDDEARALLTEQDGR